MLRGALAPIVDFAFPPRCPACGEAVAPGGHGDTDDALCVACWSALEIPGAPSCAACQRPFGADYMSDEALCGQCLIALPHHAGIAAATLYGPISRQMVLALKHGGKIVSARRMGRMIAARLPPLPPDTIVAPVPLHRWRLWRRGYNQAVLLADAIARARGLRLAPDLLVRVKRTPPLGRLNPTQRRRVLSGAIRLRPRREDLQGRTVLLVDDVMTSGATTESCVKALRRGGAAAVVIACFARVLEGD